MCHLHKQAFARLSTEVSFIVRKHSLEGPRQGQAEHSSYSRNKLHQTWST